MTSFNSHVFLDLMQIRIAAYQTAPVTASTNNFKSNNAPFDEKYAIQSKICLKILVFLAWKEMTLTERKVSNQSPETVTRSIKDDKIFQITRNLFKTSF